jgi:hypothetical protein
VTDDLGTFRWFGESWGAPACDPRAEVPVPVGRPCEGHEHMHADRSGLIEPGDQGITLPGYICDRLEIVAYHLDCWLHEVGADRITNNERTT